MCLLLLLSPLQLDAQSIDTDFHFGISRPYEDCIDFSIFRNYDSVVLVTESGKQEFVARYRSGNLVEMAYIDTVREYEMATRYHRYTNGLLREIEQSESYNYYPFGMPDAPIQVKPIFRKTYETDKLNRPERITHLHFLYAGFSSHTDSVVAEYDYSNYPRQVRVHVGHPHDREIVVRLDDKGYIETRTEYNHNNEVIQEWLFNRTRKRSTVTFNIYRGIFSDESQPKVTARYLVNFDKEGLPTTFFNNGRKLYFKYYKQPSGRN